MYIACDNIKQLFGRLCFAFYMTNHRESNYQLQSIETNVKFIIQRILNRLLDSLVIECWLRVREVPGSIPSHGPRHTKDVIKMVPVVPLFSTEH